MYSDRVQVFHAADDDAVVSSVTHDLELDLFPAGYGFFEKYLSDGAAFHTLVAQFFQFFLVLCDAAACTAEGKCRTHDYRVVDNFGKVTETYPAKPNGSPNGITSITTESGRVTIMMPHPERVFRTVSNSWHPENWGEDGPWMRIFRNARKQLG